MEARHSRPDQGLLRRPWRSLPAPGRARASAKATHPLDPLDADELIAIRDILAKSDRFSADTNFAWIGLDEPPKAAVAAFRPGADMPRRAALDAIDDEKGKTFRVVVDLKAARIASLTDLGTMQPGLTDRDSARARLIVDADPRIKALTRRGFAIRDGSPIGFTCNTAPGSDRSLEQENGRLMRAVRLRPEFGERSARPRRAQRWSTSAAGGQAA